MRAVGSLSMDRLWDTPSFWACWYAISGLMVVLLPGYIRFRVNLWHLPESVALKSVMMGMNYLGFALYVRLAAIAARRVGASILVLLGIVLCFALPWFVLNELGMGGSRFILLVGTGLAISFFYLPLFLDSYRNLGLAGMALATIALTALDLPGRHTDARTPTTTAAIPTEYYTLTVKTYLDLIPRPWRGQGAGGAIARYQDGFVLVAGDGQFYKLTWTQPGDSPKADRLSVTAPFNFREYLADQDNPETTTPFRITDLLIDDRVQPMRVYVAHEHWNHEQKCVTLRVSRTEPVESLEGLSKSPEWETIFDSKPCLSLGYQPILPKMDSYESGGTMALNPEGLLLSIGDYGSDGLNGETPFSQNMDASYGKVLLLDLAGHDQVFSIGHRNPQGLVVDRDGRIWETEQGPRGGDELNILVKGGNYGWPMATYGTQYGLEYWPLSPQLHDHGDFLEPVHAFVPSVATSQVIELSDDSFPMWSGDLLIGSLARETLYRVRKHENHVIYVEPIPVDNRVRDLVQGRDGRIVLWTDNGDIISITPGDSAPKGKVIYLNRCGSCHEPPPGATAASAPNLHRLMNRKIASLDYPYSDALRNLGGKWNESRLDSFLEDPMKIAPGSFMQLGRVPEKDQREELIKFLAGYE